MEQSHSSSSHEEQLTWMQFVSVLMHDIFFASFCIYLVSILLESIRHGIVVTVINLNLVLLICLTSGFLITFFPETKTYKEKRFWYGIPLILAGVAVGFFINQAIREATIYHIFFALCGSILTLLFGITVLFPRNSHNSA